MGLAAQVKSKKKNKSPKYPFVWFDTNIKYTIPMIPNGVWRFGYNEQPIEGVTIEQSQKDGYVHATKEGYQDKWFMDLYFEWLLYTGYVKKEVIKSDEILD